MAGPVILWGRLTGNFALATVVGSVRDAGDLFPVVWLLPG